MPFRLSTHVRATCPTKQREALRVSYLPATSAPSLHATFPRYTRLSLYHRRRCVKYTLAHAPLFCYIRRLCGRLSPLFWPPFKSHHVPRASCPASITAFRPPTTLLPPRPSLCKRVNQRCANVDAPELLVLRSESFFSFFAHPASRRQQAAT